MKTKDGETVIFIGVDYDDEHPSSYNGISVKFPSKKVVYYSGNPSFDLCCAYCHIGALKLADGIIMLSSSVDHFDMDGGQIDLNPTKEMLQIAKDYLILNKTLPLKKSKVK